MVGLRNDLFAGGITAVRLFAAIDPPDRVRERLQTVVDRLPVEGLRFVPSSQWHVTTAFYGEVSEEVLPQLVERLGRAAARSTAMTLAVRRLGTFPKSAAKARVLWAGLDGDVADLTRLADRCAAAGRRCGLTMEDRAYRAHLTLARARREPVDLRPTLAEVSSYADDPWPATTLRLVHSVLGRDAEHRTLREWPLRPRGLVSA